MSDLAEGLGRQLRHAEGEVLDQARRLVAALLAGNGWRPSFAYGGLTLVAAVVFSALMLPVIAVLILASVGMIRHGPPAAGRVRKPCDRCWCRQPAAP
ncbi:MAG: hypothetical protein GDA50_07445 [Alphaproteobacteria bacterium GM202ARS2]|nr:hypothetical protein [Alphaproteobacteria bacterium GM202ARS2]